MVVRGAQNGIQVSEEEGDRNGKADADKHPVQNANRRPADDGDGDPDQVGIAVQGPALEEVGKLAAEVSQGEEETNWDE